MLQQLSKTQRASCLFHDTKALILDSDRVTCWITSCIPTHQIRPDIAVRINNRYFHTFNFCVYIPNTPCGLINSCILTFSANTVKAKSVQMIFCLLGTTWWTDFSTVWTCETKTAVQLCVCLNSAIMTHLWDTHHLSDSFELCYCINCVADAMELHCHPNTIPVPHKRAAPCLLITIDLRS